jgi:hypothetical protein
VKRSELTHSIPEHPLAVPRNLAVELPAGMTYAAAGRMVVISPQSPCHSFGFEDWGQLIAGRASALLLVSAVQCHYVISGTTAAGCIYPFCPKFIHTGPRQRVSVCPADGHTGELWAFPLRSLSGPPTPPFTTLQDTHDGP